MFKIPETPIKAVVNKAFNRAVKKTGAVLDSETSKNIKTATISAVKTARSIAGNLSDLNGDGKVDVEDIKFAAEKAGIVWNKIDPDLKSALIAGGAAGVGANFIPFVGQLIAVPTFVVTTAYFFVVAKLARIKGSKISDPQLPTESTAKLQNSPTPVNHDE